MFGRCYEFQQACSVRPNVRAKLPAEAGFVSPVRDDSTTGADRAYKACRSGSACAADGSMSMDRLLTVPVRGEARSGSRTRLPLHPTGNLAGRFAPCLACKSLCGWPAGPELAGLGNGLLLRRAVELAPSVTSHWLRALPDGPDKHCSGVCLRGAADARTVRATEQRIRGAWHAL